MVAERRNMKDMITTKFLGGFDDISIEQFFETRATRFKARIDKRR